MKHRHRWEYDGENCGCYERQCRGCKLMDSKGKVIDSDIWS